MTRLCLALAAAITLAAPAFAASAGRPQLQTFFQATIGADYQQKAFARVARSWRQPAQPPQVGKKTVVQALISRDGKLASASVTTESGSKAWDAAALAAVKKAAPFDKLPSSFTLPTLEAHFHFEWAAGK